MSLIARMTDIQPRLDALAARHRVPGASLAIGLGDEALEFASGVVNVNTGVETTTDTVFQIGSITKLLTATMVMQLVDEGSVDLDAPVKRYLRRFELAVKGAASTITVRQLLTHTSGIQGDWFDGFGRGDDAVARYVDGLKDIDLIHEPGRMWTYCNSGWVVAGRIVEAVSGLPYRDALKEKIAQPLGLSHMTVTIDEMVRHRMAVGHTQGPDRRPAVPPKVVMEYAQVPAGSMTVATASELVRFVRAHLDGGRAPDGTRVLSAESAAAMQTVQVNRHATLGIETAQGLGWLIEDWDGKRVIGHTGGTIGQLAFLYAIPDAGLVVALLTNASSGGALWRDLGRWLLDELAGIHMPLPPKPPEHPPPLQLERYAGVYERLGVRYRVEVEGEELLFHTEMTGALADLQQGALPRPARLRAIDEQRFAGRVNGADSVVMFLEFERGRPGYLFFGRAAKRAASARKTKSGA